MKKTSKTQTSPSKDAVVLYGGRVQIDFQEEGHKYTVYVDGEKVKCPSVTTVTGVVDKSGPIQSWAIKETLAVAKSLIQPGQYYSVSELEKIWEASRKASYVKKKEAAEVGTIAHQWLELFFNNQNPDMPPEDHPSYPCVVAALAWVRDHDVKFTCNERPIYSIIHQVSGRLDGVAFVDGKKSVIDFKTGNQIYGEAYMQTAAYQNFYEEETGDKVEQRVVIRLSKEKGDFFSCTLDSNYERDFNAFLGALTLYRGVKEIEIDLKTANFTTNKKDWLDEIG